MCPSSCPDGAGKDCFHKCYKVCGDACKVDAHDGECTLGKDCDMVKPAACPTAASAAAPAPAELAHAEALGATGVASSATGAASLEVAEVPVDPCAGNEAECTEPEVITEEDMETLGDEAHVVAVQPNDPRDPQYQASPLAHADEDQLSKQAAQDAKREVIANRRAEEREAIEQMMPSHLRGISA